MDLYNLKKLVKIEVRDSYPSNWYIWKSKKTFLGITIQDQGVYSNTFKCFYERLIPDKLVLKNGILFEKAKVKLYYESNIEKTYYFDTYQDAIDFSNKIKDLSGSTFFYI